MCLSFALLFLSCVIVVATKPCARFEFPTLQDQTFTVEENTTVTLPFRLDAASCVAGDTFTIGISRQQQDYHILTDYCKINTRNETCHSTRPGCSCRVGQGLYSLTKTVDRTDSTTWYWWTGIDMVETTRLTFDIT
ncbi:hypothetical protein BaRGS_00029131, partial [Batillaria attramentaria]